MAKARVSAVCYSNRPAVTPITCDYVRFQCGTQTIEVKWDSKANALQVRGSARLVVEPLLANEVQIKDKGYR